MNGLHMDPIPKVLAMIGIFFVLGYFHPSFATASSSPLQIKNTSVEGERPTDEIWSGQIEVTSDVVVPKGRTLTIQPGTIITFQAHRDYKDPIKPGLSVFGRLRAIGTAKKQIHFTSSKKPGRNGDWGMIHLDGKTHSIFKYVIVEYGQQGINLWNSDAVISHSITRWNNWEGLYAESYSTPTIEFNRIYENGYNGMAMEQFNTATVRNNLFKKNGTHGLHVDASKANVKNNIFQENGAAGLSLDNASTVTATNNTIQGNTLTASCAERAKICSPESGIASLIRIRPWNATTRP